MQCIPGYSVSKLTVNKVRPGNQVWGGCAPDFISACGKGDNNANREALFRNDSDKKKVNHSKKLEERGSAD